MQINRQTYEEFFLLYADGELSDTEKRGVEDFVEENPDLSEEFILVQSTVMHADDSIVFENKEILYRTEEDNRKVIYMRWFRIAAAAAVMIALTVAGWLFIDERNVTQAPVAVVQKPANTTLEDKPSIQAVTPDEKLEEEFVPAEKRTASKPTITLAAKKSSTPSPEKIIEHASLVPNTTDNTSQQKSSENNLEKNIEVPAIVPAETTLAAIDMPVQPREMEPDEAQQPVAQFAAHSNYDAEPEKSDMIYFANTSITKKTKLRGVLRKATRYLDRVTSLQ